jgi:hypothetical protein
MRAGVLVGSILVILGPQAAAAQAERPRENTVAVGGDVGFLASDNGASKERQALQSATGTVDAFVEYYYTPRTSLRLMYGWAAPQFDSAPGRSLRRQHLNLNFLYNLEFGRLRVFGTVGGGAYFLSGREASSVVGSAVTKPGGSLGWGGEYYFRTFAVKSEMNVHILDKEKSFPELNDNTLTAFTWTFGIKVPF